MPAQFFTTCAEVKFRRWRVSMIKPRRSVDRLRGKRGEFWNWIVYLGTELENGIDTFVRGRGRLQHHLGREYSEFSVLSL
jgi:hypothetical protein